MIQPQIKSRRQHLRLWFEFYKLALDNPNLQQNLSKVGTFYAPWGDPRGVDFNDWWKDHAYLFGTTQVEEIAKVCYPTAMAVLLCCLALPVLPLALTGCAVLGVADTWLDLRRRLPSPQGVD